MNTDDIDKMTDQEIAEAVAKVMGWTRPDYRHHWSSNNDDYPGADYDFDPCTDANDDLTCHRFATRWINDERDNPLYNAYYQALERVMTSRDPYYKDLIPECRLYYLDNYQPGDYARALLHAAAVVTEP